MYHTVNEDTQHEKIKTKQYLTTKKKILKN